MSIRLNVYSRIFPSQARSFIGQLIESLSRNEPPMGDVDGLGDALEYDDWLIVNEVQFDFLRAEWLDVHERPC